MERYKIANRRITPRAVTKPGKCGTLYLFQIAYQDACDPDNTGTTRLWAYDKEHAVERFYDGDDTGWEHTGIHRVMEGR